jgi:hypothetical protein
VAAASVRDRATVRRSFGHGLFPPQHGAWAFLGLPVVLGSSESGWSWLLVPLTLAWVAAYPVSWAVTGLLSARRPQRFRRPFVVWSSVMVPPLLLVLAMRPWLVWVGLAYAVLFAVNLHYARAHDERALANDLVFIGECALVVPVTVAVVGGARDWTVPTGVLTAEVAVLTAVCALTLLGSTLHVKSLLRERRDPRYLRASRACALGCVPVAALAAYPLEDRAAWLALPFAALALRALLVPGREWRPGVIGMVELAGFVLVAAVAVVAV